MAAGYVDVFRKMWGWWSTPTASLGNVSITDSSRYTLITSDSARYTLVVTEIGDD